MRLEVIDGLAGRVIRADRVLITADDGTPLAVASAYGEGAVFVSHCGEANFAKVLQALGIDRTVVVESVPAPKLADFTFH